MTETEAEKMSVEAEELTLEIGPMFHGRDPSIVSAALCDLTAKLIAGYHPALRELTIERMVHLIRDLVPIVVEEMIEQGFCPPDWQQGKTPQ